MSAINRKNVRDEITAALQAALTGSGQPVSNVYGYQPGKLDGESPVILVLSQSTQREIGGIGSQKYHNTFSLELQVLVYDGDQNQDLTEKQREDKIDEIETALADWFAAHQTGTTYSLAHYAPEPSTIVSVNYLDGKPYRIESITVRLESWDA